MWPWTDWKLRRALRRYRRERDLEAVLQMDWHRDLDLSAFFTDVEERLHGEEITRLRQKQAEYLALQNQINPHFLYNCLLYTSQHQDSFRRPDRWKPLRRQSAENRHCKVAFERSGHHHSGRAHPRHRRGCQAGYLPCLLYTSRCV